MSGTISFMQSAYKESINDPPELNVRLLTNKDLPTLAKPWHEVQCPIDVLLLTVKDCEFLSCISYLSPDYKKCRHEELGAFIVGRMGKDETLKTKVAVIKCYMGSTNPGGSTIVVINAVNILRPRAVFCVGFCGGLNLKKVKIGDVVILEKLVTYGPCKVTPDGIEEHGNKVPPRRHCRKLVLSAAEGWKPPLQDAAALDVKVQRGVFLSGPEVVASTARREQLIKRFPDAVAIEMEGEGLYAATDETEIEWIVVKGVSDFADDNKSTTDKWRAFASTMAASVVVNMLSDPGVFDNWPHHEVSIDLSAHRIDKGMVRKRPSSSGHHDTSAQPTKRMK